MIIASAGIFASSISHAATLSKTSCGAVVGTIYRDDTQAFATGSTVYVTLPGTSVNAGVPAGKKRCVTVRFSATASCGPSPQADHCQVEAVLAGTHFAGLMSPQSAQLNFVSEDSGQSAHSFTWVLTIDEPSAVSMRVRVAAPGTIFVLRAWTMEVQISAAPP